MILQGIYIENSSLQLDHISLDESQTTIHDIFAMRLLLDEKAQNDHPAIWKSFVLMNHDVIPFDNCPF